MNVQRLFATGGLWQAGLDGAFGAVPVSPLADQTTLNGGGISSNAGFVLNANRGITLGASGGTINTSSGLTCNGRITGVGGLTKTGASTLLLGGASNDYTGGTTITLGTLQLTTGNNRLPMARNLAFTGGTLDLNTRSQTVNAFSCSDSVGTITSVAAGTSRLTVGNGNGSGTFGGVIQNGGAGEVGVVALTKKGDRLRVDR
jgi:fibronectin-binding autotransporter adhesin